MEQIAGANRRERFQAVRSYLAAVAPQKRSPRNQMDHPEPPYDPSLPVDNWHDLGWYFDGILIHRMCSGDKSADAFSSYDPALHTQEDVLSFLRTHEKDWLGEVESVISVIAISGEVDLTGFSPEAISIVARRAETIASFIHSFHISEDSISPPLASATSFK